MGGPKLFLVLPIFVLASHLATSTNTEEQTGGRVVRSAEKSYTSDIFYKVSNKVIDLENSEQVLADDEKHHRQCRNVKKQRIKRKKNGGNKKMKIKGKKKGRNRTKKVKGRIKGGKRRTKKVKSRNKKKGRKRRTKKVN